MPHTVPLQAIESWFGKQYTEESTRKASYALLEDYIRESHVDWTTAPPTDAIARKFSKRLAELDQSDLAFLLCHTGYIPETYAADSSQETLYSKLVEVLVQFWAINIGFDLSELPTVKSSKEDVTIRDKDNVIVCDAKTYRLGRSQKAPNVKDALKQGDIKKWLSYYPEKNRVGGLVAFPSQHDWSGGSDFYQYLTDKDSPVAMLFYEHLSYMVLSGIRKDSVIAFFKNHKSLFPKSFSKKDGNRAQYFLVINREIIDKGSRPWSEFSPASNFIIREKVSHTCDLLESHLRKSREMIMAGLPKDELDVKKLIEELIEARFLAVNLDLIRQLKNIKAFRSPL
jgi:hypothetical protein